MITLSLPFPLAELNPNRKNGKHWGAVQTAKRNARDVGYFVATQHRYRLSFEPKRLQITFIQPDKRRRDIDNQLSAAKNYLDGICNALGIDDHCFEEVLLRRGYRKGDGEMIVEIS